MKKETVKLNQKKKLLLKTRKSQDQKQKVFPLQMIKLTVTLQVQATVTLQRKCFLIK